MVTRKRRMKTLDICGIALMTVEMTLYSPCHARISRRTRATRSMRTTRRKVNLTPSPMSTVMTMSTMLIRTIVPSRPTPS